MSQPLDPDRPGSRRLARALAELASHEPQQEPCPTPEALWTAVSGDADRDQRLEVLEHTIACAHCAEAWRIARAMAEDAATSTVADSAVDNVTPFRPAAPAVPPRPAPHRVNPAWMAVAASLVAALGLGGVGWWINSPRGPSGSDPAYREIGPLLVEPLTDDGAQVPRGGFTLRWRGPAEARYRVTLATESLEVVWRRGGLTTPELEVPADVLQDLPTDSTLLWTLEASLIEGGTVTIPTRVLHLVEGPADAVEKTLNEG